MTPDEKQRLILRVLECQPMYRDLIKRCVAWAIAQEINQPTDAIFCNLQMFGSVSSGYDFSVTPTLYGLLEEKGLCLFDPCWGQPYLEAVKINFS